MSSTATSSPNVLLRWRAETSGSDMAAATGVVAAAGDGPGAPDTRPALDPGARTQEVEPGIQSWRRWCLAVVTAWPTRSSMASATAARRPGRVATDTREPWE